MANGGMMRIGRIVSYVVATCSFQALLACDPIEYASVVEIVPKTCDFWRYAGEVRSASEAADPKEVVKWSKDCGEPEEHLWRRLQFSQGSARFSIDTDVISKPDPDTISNLGSRVQFNMKGCDGKVESTAIEAIHRPLEADISNVAYLEYTLEGVNADWTVNVNRFSLASFQFDFISTTADEAFGDRLARATIGAADGSEGVFSASLCGKTFDPYKWKLEFFTSVSTLPSGFRVLGPGFRVQGLGCPELRVHSQSPTTPHSPLSPSLRSSCSILFSFSPPLPPPGRTTPSALSDLLS